jgi:quercetin dioxygenase-like cupin family protein
MYYRVYAMAGRPQTTGRSAMAVTFNQETVSAEPLGRGVSRQALLDDARVPGLAFRLERVTLEAGARHPIEVAAGALAWFQILAGSVVLEHPDHRDAVTQDHVVFLPPGFGGALSAADGATLLLARVPDAARFDPEFGKKPLALRILDWTREPVLQSEHDARKRIYLVTPTLFATKAIKGEMIIYPPGTEAANHHHQGAAHFMYILGGRGTCFADEQPFAVRQGDIVYYGDCERHYLRSDPEVEMRFVEFFVPGHYKTVWVEEAKVCAWIPQGRNIRGEKAAREIQAHTSAAPTADI